MHSLGYPPHFTLAIFDNAEERSYMKDAYRLPPDDPAQRTGRTGTNGPVRHRQNRGGHHRSHPTRGRRSGDRGIARGTDRDPGRATGRASRSLLPAPRRGHRPLPSPPGPHERPTLSGPTCNPRPRPHCAPTSGTSWTASTTTASRLPSAATATEAS
jgi:hypothetical protein